jgi:hypothetical protein
MFNGLYSVIQQKRELLTAAKRTSMLQDYSWLWTSAVQQAGKNVSEERVPSKLRFLEEGGSMFLRHAATYLLTTRLHTPQTPNIKH